MQIFAGTLGLFLAAKFIPGATLEMIPGESSFFGINFTASWQILLLAGFILGLINFFIKPIVKMITSPLRMLTFGLFGLVINMAIIWIIDILFIELVIQGIVSLFYTTLLIWLVSFLLGLHKPARKVMVEE